MLRDNDEKLLRGYREKDSIVWPDGREKLVGKDWRKRKIELFSRSRGWCEGCNTLLPFQEMHPHHQVRRSILRDDRLENLKALCGDCHEKQHPEKQTRWTKNEVTA
jgi:hypothetical protein